MITTPQEQIIAARKYLDEATSPADRQLREMEKAREYIESATSLVERQARKAACYMVLYSGPMRVAEFFESLKAQPNQKEASP